MSRRSVAYVHSTKWPWVLAAFLVVVVGATTRVLAASDDSITSPVTDPGAVDPTVVLDAQGYPVVAYVTFGVGELWVLHCDDPGCADGGESITSPDPGEEEWSSSLVLDADGNPVVAYYDFALNDDLKVMHCDDPNCAGGGESITSPDTAGLVGLDPSIALDGDGNPVVAYFDATNDALKVLHCDDPDCAGGGESITSPDTATEGSFASLALDGDGNPVVAYFEGPTLDLKVLRCDDPDCAGGNESITSPDTAGVVGLYPSLQLDPDGNPVVAYYDDTNGDLKVLHCDDPDCAGGNESITSPDTAGDVGSYPSLELNPEGNPVVSYYDETNGDLKVLHCDDPNCAGGDEFIFSPDTTGDVGQFTSLALDGNGGLAVVYRDATNGGLKVLRCDDPFCLDSTPPALALPDDMVLEATGADGARVEFEVTATDADDANPVVSCVPESGSVFPPGETVVECTASDSSGNSSSGSFTVTVTVTEEETAGFRFEDVPVDHTFDVEIHWMAELGITFGCNPPANTRFCPGENVTRGQMAAFLVRALGLPAATGDRFIDTDGSVFEDDIARLAAAGITRGCNPPDNDRFCRNDDVTRGQMAAFLVRALGLSEEGQLFEDTVGHTFEGDISRLRPSDITRGCNPPANTRYCPDDPITRGQMAAFMYRALRVDP